jgi:transposase
MVQGRSKAAFKTWLADREQFWRDRVEVVAMDGFTGFKTATAEELPGAVAVMDPLYADVLVMPMSLGSVLVGAVIGPVRSA